MCRFDMNRHHHTGIADRRPSSKIALNSINLYMRLYKVLYAARLNLNSGFEKGKRKGSGQSLLVSISSIVSNLLTGSVFPVRRWAHGHRPGCSCYMPFPKRAPTYHNQSYASYFPSCFFGGGCVLPAPCYMQVPMCSSYVWHRVEYLDRYCTYIGRETSIHALSPLP